MFKHAVFDYDGVIIKSYEPIMDSVKYWCAARGAAITTPSFMEHREALRNGAYDATFEEFLERVGVPSELRAGFMDYYKASGEGKWYEDSPLFKGLRDALNSLLGLGVTMHILSANYYPNILASIKKQNLDLYFGDQPILRVQANFSTGYINKADCLSDLIKDYPTLDENDFVFIGDQRSDMDASAQAGVPFLAATWGWELDGIDGYGTFERPCESPKHIIPSLKALYDATR